MSGPKIFIAVLFLIGLLFVVSLNIGAGRTDDQQFRTPSWVTGISGALSRSQPLKIGEVSPTTASCLQNKNFVIPLGGTCTFSIQQSPLMLRVVSLQLVQGASTGVTLTQEDTLPVQQTLTGAGSTTTADLKVYPGKTHGMLRIDCPNTGVPTPCILVLK